MNKFVNTFLIGVVLVSLIVASGAVYIVDETEQAVITQFGEPIGEPITKAGLYFKVPFIQNANKFDKRLLSWDGDPNEIQTLEKRFIWVDTTARWRIKDALKFMQSVRTEISAQARLDDILDGATRDVIANHIQVEAVRNSNELIERRKTEKIDQVIDPALDVVQTQVDPIKKGREKLVKRILDQSQPLVEDLGIELVDVRIKRINYIEAVRQKVYDRMVSERNAAAAKIRSEGQGKRAEIEGQMQKELEEIRSEAYRKAQEIKGKADAEAIKIYANAYNKDPEFYSFLKSLESYETAVGKDTNFIISTKNDFYQYFQGISVE